MLLVDLLHSAHERLDARRAKRAREKRLAAAARKRRIAAKLEYLLEALGGICAECGGTERLEIDHVDGITWCASAVTWEARLGRYARELHAGVRLRLLCRKCNGKDGRKRQMEGNHHKRRRRAS